MAVAVQAIHFYSNSGCLFVPRMAMSTFDGFGEPFGSSRHEVLLKIDQDLRKIGDEGPTF
jgi:hypothetical protein